MTVELGLRGPAAPPPGSERRRVRAGPALRGSGWGGTLGPPLRASAGEALPRAGASSNRTPRPGRAGLQERGSLVPASACLPRSLVVLAST